MDSVVDSVVGAAMGGLVLVAHTQHVSKSFAHASMQQGFGSKHVHIFAVKENFNDMKELSDIKRSKSSVCATEILWERLSAFSVCTLNGGEFYRLTPYRKLLDSTVDRQKQAPLFMRYQCRMGGCRSSCLGFIRWLILSHVPLHDPLYLRLHDEFDGSLCRGSDVFAAGTACGRPS